MNLCYDMFNLLNCDGLGVDNNDNIKQRIHIVVKLKVMILKTLTNNL